MNDPGAVRNVNQPLLFQRLRLHVFRNSMRTLLQGTPVRLITIILCSLVVWCGVFAASAFGFHDLKAHRIPFAGGIVGTLFDLLFFALAVMLVFSTGIILYSSLFSSPETSYLLTTPADADQVFAYKYQGAITFSSWAFILLGGPILIAYGVMFSVPWYFYPLLLLFFIGFVLLPGSFGALFCLLMVNYLPRKPKHILVCCGGVVLALGGLWLYRIRFFANAALANPDALQRLFGQFAFAQGPFVPSHWMSRGIEAAARGDAGIALYMLALVWSNGLFLYVLAAWTSRHLYRRGYNRQATGGSLRRRYGGGWMDHTVTRLLPFLHPQTRLLIVKDFRTFRRDPAQWAQLLIFAGLLAFYTTGTRRFYNADIGQLYQNGVSLLNLTATAFLLCAYTGRFIYPMLSLEGRKFWILGLLPLKRERLLWGKFAFSAAGAVVTAECLVLFSDLLLAIPWQAMALHALAVFVLSLGLSGLSVGLGACLPSFRESDPSKIAVGFGGTLNLVVGLLFLISVVLLMVVPYHFWQAAITRAAGINERAATFGVAAGVLAGCAVGAAAVVVPLRLGVRALRRMEF
jgi:ABC-2 type transport system permease protein